MMQAGQQVHGPLGIVAVEHLRRTVGLLDRDLARAVAATGKDPWLDEDDQDDSGCEPLPAVVALERPRG